MSFKYLILKERFPENIFDNVIRRVDVNISMRLEPKVQDYVNDIEYNMFIIIYNSNPHIVNPRII
jgi:hypothetical protein